MRNEDKLFLETLFYNAEEYYHYNNEQFSSYATYLNDLTNRIDDITEEDLKLCILNWFYKNKVYKTININSITIPYNNYMSLNVLYGLMIRECSRYDYNTHPATLHIEFDHTKVKELSLDYFKRLEQFFSVFKKKKIRLFNNMTFVEDFGEYLLKNDYEFIHEINFIDDIKEEMGSIHLNVTDDNIINFEEYIKKAVNMRCNKFYLTNICKDSKNIDIYRYNLDEFIFKYNTMNFSIISEDYLPGKDLYIDNDFVGLKSTNTILHSRTKSLEDIITSLKKDLISKQYISNNCIDCSEKVLCMLGASDERCPYKLF
jgi:hypothetical protein